MKITELHDAILNAIRREKFVGEFEVTIYQPRMTEGIKITGYKRDASEFPYDFSGKLQSEINSLCFNIVCGFLYEDDFTFGIKGRIEYLREYKEKDD